MPDAGVLLLGPRYVLGEIEEEHTAIAGLAERAAALRVPLDAALMGWGRVHRSERSLEALAVESGRATLAAAGVPPAEVDALFLCSTFVPGPSEGHGSLMESVLGGIGLGDIAFYGLTLNRCTNLLAALELAGALLLAGRYRRILVVTTDRVRDEAERMAAYALFSDGAASCLLTVAGGAPAGEGYEVVGHANAQHAASLEWSKELSSDLAREANERLLGPLGMKLGEIAGLCHANIVKPLLVVKELQAGFTPAQLRTANIARVGHCFSADPLINLADREAAGEVEAGSYYLLAVSVPGSRFATLLRRRSR